VTGVVFIVFQMHFATTGQWFGGDGLLILSAKFG
jgi:hypothetical protein